MRPKLKLNKKIIYLLIGIPIILFVFNLLLANWAKNSFPKFIKEKNDTAYHFEFKDIDFSFFGQSLVISEISIFPKPDSANDLKTDFSADIKKIKISGVDFIRLIRSSELEARKIQIIGPDIRYYESESEKKPNAKTELSKSIHISNFIIRDGDFHYFESDRKSLILSVGQLNVNFLGVKLDQETIEKKMPFAFSDYEIGCDSFFWQINPSQQMKSNQLRADSKEFQLFGFTITTTDSLANVNSVDKGYRLLPDVDSKEFSINDMDWGFSKQDEFYFKTSKIEFDSALVRISENKNTTKKDKTAERLFPFLVEIDRISVKNSKIEVENSIKVHDIDLEISKIKNSKDKNLEIDSVFFNQPMITVILNQKSYRRDDVTVSPFKENVEIGKLNISHARLKLSDPMKNTLTDASENLNLALEKISVIPKPNYNRDLKDDNFIVRLDKLSLETDKIRIGESGQPNFKENSDKPLIPINFEIGQIDFRADTVEQKRRFGISPVKLTGNELKNDIDGGLKISMLKLGKSEITVFQSTKKKAKQAAISFKKDLKIDLIEFEKSNFKLIEPGNRTLLSINDLNLTFNGVESNQNNQFSYKNSKLSASALKYHPKGNYDLTVDSLSYDRQTLKFNQFEMKPKISKTQFVRSLKKQKDYYSIKAREISVQKPNINFSADHFSFRTPLVSLNSADAYIYRSKIPPDDTSKKKMYSQLLREMKFGLNISKLKIRNSKLVYEEETATSDGAGKLIFNNFSADISNLSGGYKKSKMPNVNAVITANFMNDSKLKVNWSFNPMNRNENFNIKGSISNFDAARMTPFVKPYLHATADGNVKEVDFNFSGNDHSASGDFGIKYDNLKVTLYNPKTGKTRDILSKIGNLALKSNTRDEFYEVKIKEVERKKDKSFFNFLWLCVQQGLKQTVLII
ncbi:MAG: hypothetical protein WCY16_05220 [Weeksellaceae bacterium]